MADRRETTLGIGGNVAGAWKIGGDTIMGYTAFGKGIARYVENLVGTNSDMDLNDAGTDLEACRHSVRMALTRTSGRRIPIDGRLRLHKGRSERPAARDVVHGFLLRDGQSAVESCRVARPGIEYIYGTHDVKDGEGAHATRIQFAAKYDFFRKRPMGSSA